VTFSATAQTVVLTFGETAAYQASNILTIGVGTAGTVEFFQEGRTIPGCASIKASRSGVATCTWKPSRLGTTRIQAIFTPASNAFAPAASNVREVTVIPRE
jgi:hypothetical protein